MKRLGSLYGQDITFLGISKCDLEFGEGEYDAVILGAPYDGGTSYRSGTRFGPQSIRITDYIPQDLHRPHLALGIDPLQQLKIADAGDSEMPPTDIDISLKNLRADVASIKSKHAIPFILGGDHSITYANIMAISDVIGRGKFGVIHFDAHPDTADEELGQKHGHGQWVRRVIEKNVINGNNFVQFGIRGYWPGEDVLGWMKSTGMRAYEMTEVRHRGLEACIEEAVELASRGMDGIFLSVDVDVCDPSYMPGTGTPEPGGLTSWEILKTIRDICTKQNIVGFDIVELNPAYDWADVSALLANRIVLEALSGVTANKFGHRDQNRGLLEGRGEKA